MTESSAAGYQLRRHYQKYLLVLECQDTNQNMQELIQHAEKLKKKKKEKEPGSSSAPGPSTPAQQGPPTPSSIRSAATPTPSAGPSSSAGPGPAQPPPVPAQPGKPITILTIVLQFIQIHFCNI